MCDNRLLYAAHFFKLLLADTALLPGFYKLADERDAKVAFSQFCILHS